MVLNASNKKISILGCGWIGLPLARLLQSTGYNVKGSVASVKKKSETDSHTFKQYQICLPRDLRKAAVRDFFDCELLVITIPPGLDKGRALGGLSCYIKELMEYVANSCIRHVIYLSSTAVYGAARGLITEETLPLPESGRAENILYLENVVSSSPYISAVILRCAGLAGYDRDPGKFLAGRLNVPAPAKPVNILHRDDCISIIENIISSNKTNGIYNLCADLHPARRDFYVSRALKLGMRPPTFLEGGGSENKIISNDKVKRQLGYCFKFPDPMKMP